VDSLKAVGTSVCPGSPVGTLAVLGQPQGLISSEAAGSCAAPSATAVGSGRRGKKLASVFLRLKCKMVLIWAFFYKLRTVLSQCNFILE